MRLGPIVAYLSDFALFWPGVLVSIVVSFAVARRVGVWLGRGRFGGGLLIFSLGLIAAATLTPSREALRFGALGSGTCDLSRIGLAPLREVVTLGDPGFNILLFLPLGIAIGLLPWSRVAAALLVMAVLLPPAIEATQLVVRALDRGCQASDVVDNLSGLLIGMIIGATIQWLRGGRDSGARDGDG